MTCSARVVLPADSGPYSSVTRPRGMPPTPSARSSSSAPVGMTVISRCAACSPSFMIEPLPWLFTICAIAVSSAFSFSIQMPPRSLRRVFYVEGCNAISSLQERPIRTWYRTVVRGSSGLYRGLAGCDGTRGLDEHLERLHRRLAAIGPPVAAERELAG